MFSLLGTLIIGLIVGAIAKLIVPGREPGGCLITMAIGIAGSFVAFYLGRMLGWTSGHPDSLRPVGFHTVRDRRDYPFIDLSPDPAARGKA